MPLSSLLRRQRPTVIGLDIGSTAVKLVELSLNAGAYRVDGFAIEPIPPNAVVEQDIAQPEVVGDAIRRVVGRAGSKQAQAAVAVASSSAITKIITMAAALSDAEMESSIQLEADQYIPYPLDEVYLDFEVLGPSPKGQDLVDVLLVASRSENVDRRAAAVEAAGLETRIVDIEAYALENAVALLGDQLIDRGVDRTIALVDIGATMTSLNVLHNGRIIYTRDQVFGGRQLIDEITRTYDMSFEQASAAIRTGDLPEDYVSSILTPFAEATAQQVSRAIQFFLSSSEYNQIDQIVLTGGCATINGIDELIQHTTGVEAITANPFVNMACAPKVNRHQLMADAPMLMIACGLALRSFD